MELTEAQTAELNSRYEERFKEKGDTLTFHEAFEVRHAYFNELRSAKVPAAKIAESAKVD